MIPAVGATCLYTLIPKFATLNGVYRNRAETTFLDAVASGVDFVANLYTPAGLSQTDFNIDYASYRQDAVLVLESVLDSSIVYYVPESIFHTVPDPTINEYYNLVGVIQLGVFKNTSDILPALDSIKDTVQAQLGVTDPLRVVTNTSNKMYLTDGQYESITTARSTNIRVLSPLSVQLAQANKQIQNQAAKIAAYEALIAQLTTG